MIYQQDVLSSYLRAAKEVLGERIRTELQQAADRIVSEAVADAVAAAQGAIQMVAVRDPLSPLRDIRVEIRILTKEADAEV